MLHDSLLSFYAVADHQPLTLVGIRSTREASFSHWLVLSPQEVLASLTDWNKVQKRGQHLSLFGMKTTREAILSHWLVLSPQQRTASIDGQYRVKKRG